MHRICSAYKYRRRVDPLDASNASRFLSSSSIDSFALMTHQTQLVPVPQVPYSVTRAFSPLPSITFEENGSPGVNLGRALNNELQDLHHADFTPVLTSTAQKITLRINWPGYLPWCDVVHVFDHCYEAHPVTLARLAHLVARKVQLCLIDLNTNTHRASATNPAWFVDGIDINDLELVRLQHVAKGSWQPVLAYRFERTRG